MPRKSNSTNEPENDGPQQLQRRALWKTALKTKRVKMSEIVAVTQPGDQRSLLYNSLRLAEVAIEADVKDETTRKLPERPPQKFEYPLFVVIYRRNRHTEVHGPFVTNIAASEWARQRYSSNECVKVEQVEDPAAVPLDGPHYGDDCAKAGYCLRGEPTGVTCPHDSCDLEDGVITQAELAEGKKNA